MEGLGRGVDDVKNPMRAKRIIPFCLVAIGILVLASPLFYKLTNCGGNTMALSKCLMFAHTAKLVADENGGHFAISKSGAEDLAFIFRCCLRSDFLLKTNFSITSATNREIIIVCKPEFDNVPQPTIWNFYHKNPAHAVGYSDGTFGLISPAEFSKLSLNKFVSAASLVTHFGANISK